MKKTFLFLLLAGISLASCSNPFDSTSNSTSNPTTEVANSNNSVVANSNNQVVTLTKGEAESETNSIIDAVDKVFDSVVVINASFVGQNSYSSGSGVIIGSSETASYIATCHHVIEDASNYEVILSNGTSYSASLLGGDDATDLAVLSIPVTGLTVSAFTSDSDTIKVGSTAIAIGNPLGTLANSVTAGIVSASKRSITMSDGTVQELMQTDAAINSGNSGGGLFNIRGELIGIVSAKYSATGVEGLGFAIPSNTVSKITTELIEHGYVVGRYKLGLTIKDGVYSTGGFFGNRYQVVYVSDVTKNSSCYGAIKAEDILASISISFKDSSKTSISLDNITSASQVEEFLSGAELEIGDKITFNVYRNGYGTGYSTTAVEVTLVQYKYSA